MVQVLPSRERGYEWGDIGAALGGGISKGYEKGTERAFEMAENAKKMQAEKELRFQKEIHDINLQDRKYQLMEDLQGSKQKGKDQSNLDLLTKFQQAFAGEEPPENPSQRQPSQRNPSEENLSEDFQDITPQEPKQKPKQSSLRKKIPVSQIAAMSLVNAPLAKTLQSHNDQIDKDERFDKSEEAKDRRLQVQQDLQKKQYDHSHTQKYGEEIERKSEVADQVLNAVEASREAIKSGKTGPSAGNIFYKILSSKKNPLAYLFQTKEGQTLVNAAKTMAGTTAKEMFNKPTEREFFWLENILPDILKSNEVNEESLKFFEDLSKYNQKKGEIYHQIIKENGGYRPIDISSKINEKMKQTADNLVEEGYKVHARQRQGKPLNYDEPEDKEVMDSILDEANGDKKEALRIALERGYTF